MVVRDKKTNSKGKGNGAEVVSLMARISSLALRRAGTRRIIQEGLGDIRKALGASACWLLWMRNGGTDFTSVGWPKLKRKRGHTDLPEGLSPRILEPICPLRCNDIRNIYRVNRSLHRFLRAGNTHRFMGILLRQGGVPMGVLGVSRGLESPEFTKKDLKLLGALGAVLSPIPSKAQHIKLADPWSLVAAIIDNFPSPAFIKDRRHRWVMVNPCFAELIGFERERMLGKSDFNFFPKEQAGFSWKKDREVFRTGDVVDVSRESVTDAEGTLRCIRSKRAPLRDAAGKITHLVVILEDVTLLKQMEQTLVEKERIVGERARLLADLRKLDDVDQILTRVCEAVRDSGLFERAVMTLHKPGGNIFNLGQVGLPADVVEQARKAPPISRTLKARITSKRFRISDSFFVPVEAGLGLNKSGRYIPQQKPEANGGNWRVGDELFVPLRDFSGQTMGYLSVDSPATRCRPHLETIQALEILVEAAASRVREIEVQQALKDERDFSQSILDTANSMIVCLDADARITAFNRECERVTGYRREEVLGERWPDLFLPPEARHDGLKSFARWVRLRPRDRYEGQIVTKRGETRTILWSNTAILGPQPREVTAIAIGHDVTERKETRNALEESERRYRGLFEDSPVSLWEEDFSQVKEYIDHLRSSGVKDFRAYFKRHPQAVVKCASKVKVTDVNRASLEMYGAKSKQELISGFDRILSRESYDPFREELISIAQGKTVFEREAIIQNLRGQKNYVVIRWTVAPGCEETLSKVLVSVLDITERKQTEEALREGEERYRLLVQNLTDMIVKFDTRGRLLFASPSYCKTFGKSEHEILGKKFMPLIHKADRAYVESALAGTSKPPHVVYLEERAKTVDGWRWQAWMNTAVLDQDGNVVHVVAVGRDITQRKQAEQALRRQEEQYRTLVETAQEGIGITDPKENLTFVNQAFADLLGYRKDELLGKNLMDLSEESQYTIFKRETVRRKAGTVSKYEAVLLTKSKRPIPVYVSAVPMTGEDGSFTGTLGVLTDLTEIKKVQEYNILLNTSRSLARSLNSDQVLQVGIDKITQTLKAERCAAMMVDDSSPDSAISLKVYAPSRKGKNRMRVLKLKTTKDGLSSYQRTLRAHPGFQVSDAGIDPLPELARLILRKAGMTSALIIPVFQRNRMLAVFHVGMAKESRSFATDQVRLVLTMANQVGAALQNCRLMDDLKSEHQRIIEQAKLLKARYGEQRMMFELTQLLGSTRNLDQLLKSASKKVVQLLKIERASVVLADPERRSLTIKAIYPQTPEQNRGALGYTFTPEVYPQEWKQLIRDNKPFVCSDLSTLSQNAPAARYFRSRGIKSTVAMPLVSRGNVLGFLTASTTKNSHQFTQDEIRLLRAISDPIAIAIENYKLLDDLRRKYDQIEEQAAILQRRTKEQEILLKVSQALSKTMNLDGVIQTGTRLVASVLGVDRCGILLPTESGNHMEFKGITAKTAAEAAKIMGRRLPLSDLPAGSRAIREGRAVVISDTSELAPGTELSQYCKKMRVSSVLGVGMFSRGKLTGVLAASTTGSHRTFTRDEIRLVQAIANQVAVAVQNAKLLEVVEKHTEDVRRLAAELMHAQEDARKNIAQELHDHQGQMLLSMKVNLDRMQKEMSARPDHPKHTQELLSDTRDLLGQTIEQIRTLTLELHPPMLEDFGLIPTLKWAGERFADRWNIKVILRTKGRERRYAREIEVALFRIVQEALANVSKHARASEVTLLVSSQASNLIVSVRDNGVGFDSNEVLSAPKGGMGLLNIKERVDILGGKLEIVSQPRKGTTLNINIPSSEVKHEED